MARFQSFFKRFSPYVQAAPLLVVLLLFLIGPLIVIGIFSFFKFTGFFTVPGFEFTAYTRIFSNYDLTLANYWTTIRLTAITWVITLVIGFTKLTFVPNRGREDNRWIVQAWPRELEQQYYQDEKVRAAELPQTGKPSLQRNHEEFREVGKNATVQHFQNFFDSVRNRKPTIEDETAGHRAAACAHLINDSAENDRINRWDFRRERQRA